MQVTPVPAGITNLQIGAEQIVPTTPLTVNITRSVYNSAGTLLQAKTQQTVDWAFGDWLLTNQYATFVGPAGAWPAESSARVDGPIAAAIQALVSAPGTPAKWQDNNFLTRPDGSAVAVNAHLGTFTWAARPDFVTAPAGARWFCSTYNCDFIRNLAGTAWQLMSPTVFLFDLVAANAALSATEQVVKSYSIPAGLLTSLRWWSLQILASKNGAVDAVTVRGRLGTTGSISDTQILTTGGLTAVNRYSSIDCIQAATSPTNLRLMAGNNAVGFNGSSANTAAFIPPINIATLNMATLDMLLTVTLQPSGATDLATVNHVVFTGY